MPPWIPTVLAVGGMLVSIGLWAGRSVSSAEVDARITAAVEVSEKLARERERNIIQKIDFLATTQQSTNTMIVEIRDALKEGR